MDMIKHYITLIILMFTSVNAKETLTFSLPQNTVIQEISARVLVEAYQSIGYKVNIVTNPNARSLANANSGLVDGEVSRIEGISKKFPQLIRIKVPINFVTGQPFAVKKNISITRWEDLKNYVVICVRGIQFVERNLKSRNISCKNVTYTMQAFKMLERNRGDVTVLPLLTGLNANVDGKYPDILPVGEPLVQMPLYHYLNQSNIELVPVITEVLKSMKESGRIDEIRQQFLVEKNLL